MLTIFEKVLGTKSVYQSTRLCEACRENKETGIAGYTLISNSHGLRLKSHTPFKGMDRVLNINSDIHSQSHDIETYIHRILVKDSDIGIDLIQRINQLKLLLYAYKMGIIKCVQ